MGTTALEGGSGADILFGGSGADSLTGGAGEDLLIGGTFVYFNEGSGSLDPAAAFAVKAEWTRPDLPYSARVANLSFGGGYNGGYVVNASTVGNDFVGDTISGGAGLDWFVISNPFDLMTDKTGSETATNIL